MTLSLSGTLDKALSSGYVSADLDVKLLSIVDKKVSVTTPFHWQNPQGGLPSGDIAITVGPFSLPNIPGDAVIKGRVTLTDHTHHPVACVALDIDAPALAQVADEAPPASGLESSATPVALCSGPDDHLKGLHWKTSAGVSSITGSLDEDVSKFVVKADLTLHVGWLKHLLKLDVPVTYTPGFKHGPFKATVGPANNSESAEAATSDGVTLNFKPRLNGKVTFEDSASQEIMCLNVNTGSSAQHLLVV
jgi:hypothetical protein